MRRTTIFSAFIITCFLATSAFAHRVNIFAWAEGSTIHTESTFSSGKKAQSSGVTATDKKTGRTIATGTTNRSGEWSFTLPADATKSKDPIVITLDAGQGHASTWTLEREDFANATPAVSPIPVAITTQTVTPVIAPTATTDSVATVTLTQQQLDALIQNAVRKELVPLTAQVAKLNAQILQPTTSMKDIFGGIGYILGLLGLAAFMQYRKKS